MSDDDDAIRDLKADLEIATSVPRMLREKTPEDFAENRRLVALWMETCIPGWPVALRRALHAEAKAERLLAAMRLAAEQLGAAIDAGGYVELSNKASVVSVRLKEALNG